ncbi:MAG: ABC transporter substrate-binding protein [Desulfurococcales archaeon]|nr:ABC transporter substrate-binding protein [Desulfurococcales archaeon]
MSRLLAAIILAALMILPPVAMAYHANAAYVNTIIIKRIEDNDAAVGSLMAGSTQGRLFALPRDLATKLLQAGFKAATPASGLVNILVNPYPKCPDGHPNLFANHKARLALQFLIDRDAIVTNIYKGYAIPVLTWFTPYDPDYPHVLSVLAKWNYIIKKGGQKEGIKLMTEALQELGAHKGSDGKWYWSDGKPVTVNFVIRTEDERRQIGDMLASTLESIGITVNRIYKNFAGAFKIVYAGDASQCQWQLYTEGWGITGMTAYDYADFVWFYSSIWGSMPQAPSKNWTYSNPKIDKLATWLDSGNYTTEKQFWDYLLKGMDLGINDSVRVFIAATFDIYVYSPDISGVITSPKASPWNVYTFLNLQYSKGTTVTFSNRYVYASGWIWNPIGGFADFYSRPVYEAITWPGVTTRITDGKTGWSPANHITWKLVRGPVKVPGDAIFYNTKDHKWETFAQAGKTNVTAKNEVIYNMKYMPKFVFHDGSKMSMADIMATYWIILEYSSSSGPKDVRYEQRLFYDYYTLVTNLVGLKIINSTAIAVYTNYNHIDPGYIAATMSPWTAWPLELIAAMDQLFVHGNGTYVFDYQDARSGGKVGIHLISSKQCALMAKYLEQIKDNPPDWVKQLMNMGLLTMSEWQTRVQNLINFYKAHGHMLVSLGPFYLDKYDAVNDVAYLKRWTYFPFSPSQVVGELLPKKVTMTANIPDTTGFYKGAKLADLQVKVNGKPATKSDVIVYAVIVNPKTFNTTFAQVSYLGPGHFQVLLPKQYKPGTVINLNILVYPVGYSVPATAQKSVTLLLPPSSPSTTTTTSPTTTSTTTTPKTTTTHTTTTHTTTTSTTSPTKTTSKPTATTPATTTSATTTTTKSKARTAAIVTAVIVIIIIIAAAAYMLRK